MSDVTREEAARGGSEDMLHYSVDTLLRMPLRILSERFSQNLSIKMDRNTRDEYVLIRIF
jgi:hypothetical protein